MRVYTRTNMFDTHLEIIERARAVATRILYTCRICSRCTIVYVPIIFVGHVDFANRTPYTYQV